MESSESDKDVLNPATEESNESAKVSASSLIPHPTSLVELTIAVAKGRMQADALGLLKRAGIEVSDAALASRRLSIEDESGRYRFIFVKAADVPVYVEHGIADCGIVGYDVLHESEADVYQPLDLGIGRCRLVVAAKKGEQKKEFGVLHVATKYPRLAAEYFGGLGIPVEIITLSGSVELAPVLGLSERIVDLVETGRTLAENGLEVVATIIESTGRLVVNRASYQLKAGTIALLIEALSANLDRRAGQSDRGTERA